MGEIPFDVSGVNARPPLRLVAAADGEPKRKRKQPKPGTFAARVKSARRSLMTMVRDGVPEPEYLPASEGMLLRGKRHQWAAPAKVGKSIGLLAHAVDMVLAGGRVAILDRENGSRLYAQRLSDIVHARGLSDAAQGLLEESLEYYEFPVLRRTDGDALARLFIRHDLVVFDAQRMFLSDWGLREDQADDYALWVTAAVDPLFREGIATLILDNTGHAEQARSRGSAAKGDLNEVLLSLKVEAEFDLYRTGRLLLKVERSRFGNLGEWRMNIGGGVYGSWEAAQIVERDDFKRVVIAILTDSGKPLGMDKLVKAARESGVKIQTDRARKLLGSYAADASCEVRKTPDGFAVEPRPIQGRGGRRGVGGA